MNDFDKEIRKAFRKGMRDGFLAGLPLIIAMILFAVWFVIVLSGCSGAPEPVQAAEAAEYHTIQYVMTNQSESARTVSIEVVSDTGVVTVNGESVKFPANNNLILDFQLPVGVEAMVDIWSPQGVLGITCAINDLTLDVTIDVEASGTEDNFRTCKGVVK